MPTQTLEQQPILTHYRFSVADYHRMADLDILPQGARVELLDGEIVEMTPAKSKHAGMINRLTRLFVDFFRDRAVISIQNPIYLDEYSGGVDHRPGRRTGRGVQRAGSRWLWESEGI